MHFTIQGKIKKQLFLIRHSNKYKLFKDGYGLIKFVHAEVAYLYFLCFFRWLVRLFRKQFEI